MKRHDWIDALLDAQIRGDISDGAMVLGIKLARVMQWDLRGRAPGLYWKNGDACEAVGVSRSSFFRHRKTLIEAGLLAEEDGNLHPILGTDQCQFETDSPTGETESSQIEHPYGLVVDAAGSARMTDGLPALSATTTYGEITERYPDHDTDPDHFARMLACTTTVAFLKHWPDHPPIDATLLVNLFGKALQRYPRPVLFAAVKDWLEERAGDPGMRKPVGVFYTQAWSLFDSTALRQKAAL